MLVLPGLIAVALYRDLFKFGPNGEVLNGDIAYPTMIINLLPTGLVGVMIAALLAALMGAMSSVFNSASTLVTLDFYKKIKPDATELQLVGFGRVMTGFMVILGLAWVPFIHLISSQLYIYLQSVQGYISPPIAACFILGILWPRLNAQGAITSLLTGFVLGAVRFIFELMDRAAGGHAFDNAFLRGLVGMNFHAGAGFRTASLCGRLLHSLPAISGGNLQPRQNRSTRVRSGCGQWLARSLSFRAVARACRGGLSGNAQLPSGKSR